MSVRLFVGNLPYDTTETDLREFFSPVGSLSSVIIPTDRDTGKPRGFAFVEFDDPALAEESTRRLNNQPLKGRTIAINEARAKTSRSSAGTGGRSGYPVRAGGFDRVSSPGFAKKPATGRYEFDPDPAESERASRAERRSRNFGANAKPARKRKSRQDSRSEMGWKKRPIRERVGGQFFGSYEDDLYEDEKELDTLPGYAHPDEEEAL
jgi:cold-inducible RNA-binding protein